ncbi:hypothetical protein AX17_007091 [Amanita inopinata Kibby_2008]|nr:hypothetical protein AX17_007091 [Amanita inopinata Kibby_2008]
MDDSASGSQKKQGKKTVKPVEAPGASKRFNAEDADIIFQSIDDIKYHIHRKNLECAAGAFPGSEFEGKKDDVVHITEDSDTLDLLFLFMYPERQPNLRKASFRVLASVAEAAEKYEVFSAMATCHTFMAAETDKHPLEVLVYAAKHDYPDLLDKSAMKVIGEPLDAVIDRMPPAVALSWVRYYQKWRDAYSKIVMRPSNCTCGSWHNNSLTVLDRLGGKIESLSNIDDTFQPAVARDPKVQYYAVMLFGVA